MDDWFCLCLCSHAGLWRSATEKSGCAQGVNDVEDVSVNQINGVRINFIPENAQGEELTSKKFKETITFNRVGWIQIQKVTPQGKKPYYQQILHPFNNVVQVAE